MGAWRRGPAEDPSAVVEAELDDIVIDLRGGEARTYAIKPPSTYGYDAVVPEAWRTTPVVARRTRRSEQPLATRAGLPQRFRLHRRFPPLQRIVHYGPIDGSVVDVKLTVARSIELHSTGIEYPLSDLDGRVREHDHLRLLTDVFGRDRRSLATHLTRTPRTLAGAKREWHKSIVARTRYGFAVTDDYLVLLEYLSPERDSRRRTFGIAYKRIVVAYQIELDDVDRHPRQHRHDGPW